MNDRTPFLMFGRRFHNSFCSTIRNGDGGDPINWAHEKPIFAHYACGMFLSGCLSFLESTYGREPWKHSTHTNDTFDTFISKRPEKQRNNFTNANINVAGIEALVCIRNAFVHNNCDLSRNHDTGALQKVTNANFPGLSLETSTFTLISNSEVDFMNYPRLALVAIAQFHGEG